MDIRINDLFHLYASGDETVVALRGLHLDVQSGECLVVKGPNGSGKSTLVKILTGFLRPSAGKVLIDGMDLSNIDPPRLRRDYVASIDQRGNLLRDMTVVDNIALAFTLAGASLRSSQRQARDLLDAYELGHVLQRFPEQLSAGERQMCSLLAVLATKPKILVADEPSGELDRDAAEVVYRMIKAASGQVTVILVTHDSNAERIADRVVRIRDGRISEEWRPGAPETSVVDPFGWMRVREKSHLDPVHSLPQVRSSRADETILVRGESLDLKYGEKSVFAQVDVRGVRGELIALSSPSGTGKSSLLRILGGIQNPTSGTVYVGEKAVSELSREDRAVLRREFIGFLAQGDSSITNITLGEYLGPAPSTLIEDFDSKMNRPLSRFSGGERARIELLRILAQRRPVLLLDEPTSQTDEHRSEEIVGLLLNYVNEGGLVITSTRDEALLACANQVISTVSC